MSEHRLVTLGISHFCEKARWALQHAGVPFVEDAHIPLLHVPAVRRAGGNHATPVLRTAEGETVVESARIVAWADARRTRGDTLFPAGSHEAIGRWVTRFDAAVGPAVRRIAYDLLLPHRALMLRGFGALASPGELRLARWLYPLIRGGIRRGLRIDAEGVRRSKVALEAALTEVEAALTEVEAVLAEGEAVLAEREAVPAEGEAVLAEGEAVHGGRYLVGSGFTAADLTFAALMAPMVAAPGYGGQLPDVSETPAAYQALVAEYRARPAGRYALEVYARHR